MTEGRPMLPPPDAAAGWPACCSQESALAVRPAGQSLQRWETKKQKSPDHRNTGVQWIFNCFFG
jgi:hypothetical protein